MPKKKKKKGAGRKKTSKKQVRSSAKKTNSKGKSPNKAASPKNRKSAKKHASPKKSAVVISKSQKKDVKKISLRDKIKLEKSRHSLAKAVNKKYGKYVTSVSRPTILVLKIVVGFVTFFAVGLMTMFLVFGGDLPDVSQLKTMDFSETTVIYDREGNILYRIFEEENRKYVPLSYISHYAIDGTLAIEDKHFYSHLGFDPMGIIRAQLKNIESDDIKQGASTITQQLAKNIFLSPEKSYERKIKELLLSIQIESIFTKEEILEMYLNKIAYGSNAYGIEAASKTFYGKSSKDLNLPESIILAALPKAPSYYSPYGQNKKELMGYCKTPDTFAMEVPDEELLTIHAAPPEILEGINEEFPTEGPIAPPIFICSSADDENYIKGRKDLVLDRMVEDGHLTKAEAHQAWKDSFSLEFKNPVHKIENPHFVFYVKEYLERKYGKELVENGGLEVVTTLDPKLQSLAEETIANKRDYLRSKFGAKNASMVALDPKTGQVLAMVGSVDYWDLEIDGQVNVATSTRQPGSAFKPLVYAAAIQNGGIGSGTILTDGRTKFNNNYVPRNSDNKYKGRMTVRTALASSRNIPAIKAFYIAGEEEKLLDFLDRIGIKSLRKFKTEFNETSEERGWTFHYGPAMAIGSGEVTLLELVGGFGTLANGGKYMVTNPILEIRDRHGNVLEKYEPTGEQAIDPQVAYIINNILSDVWARPGGSWRYGLTIADRTVAAKTGTSNKKIGRTNYPNNLLTAGYTPSLASAFWVGNSDGSQLYYYSWGLTGAAPLWKEFMTAALADYPDEPFPEPEGLVWRGREIFPSFEEHNNYDAMFKSEDKDEDEEEEEEEKDDAGVPVNTFVGERIEDDFSTVVPEGIAPIIVPDIPEPDFVAVPDPEPVPSALMPPEPAGTGDVVQFGF